MFLFVVVVRTILPQKSEFFKKGGTRLPIQTVAIILCIAVVLVVALAIVAWWFLSWIPSFNRREEFDHMKFWAYTIYVAILTAIVLSCLILLAVS